MGGGESVTWDQIQTGDQIILYWGKEWVPLRIGSQVSPGIWEQVCECGQPECTKSVGTINMQKAFATGTIEVFRGTERIHAMEKPVGPMPINEPKAFRDFASDELDLAISVTLAAREFCQATAKKKTESLGWDHEDAKYWRDIVKVLDESADFLRTASRARGEA
jgi:hypothetical protein